MMASTAVASRTANALLSLGREIVAMGSDFGADGVTAMESVRLARKVSLLIHLLEEIRDFVVGNRGEAPAITSGVALSPWSRISELVHALEAAKRFLKLRGEGAVVDFACKNMAIQYQFVTWQLEKVLGSISYGYFRISEEVLEEVELVRAQLRRETEKSGSEHLSIFQELYRLFTFVHVKSLKRLPPFRLEEGQYDHVGNIDQELVDIVALVAEVMGKSSSKAGRMAATLNKRVKQNGNNDASQNAKPDLLRSATENKSDTLVIPEDFRCPISLELMTDPVIVSTGQTYERSFIQRWINSGSRTCPKTQQKLQNLTLTPNYILKSLIMQWCEANKIKLPTRGRTKTEFVVDEEAANGSLIDELVSRLFSMSPEMRRSSAAEIRLLAKKSMANRKLIAEAGAIPALVSLLRASDQKTQVHAVTSLLNLSIYVPNKKAIIVEGAAPAIIQVLRDGTMEARENAAACVFSLSLKDGNKVSIGGVPGAMEALVHLLGNGSPRGKQDAAAALFNLCKYHGNKPLAVRAGIVGSLVQMLKDSSMYQMEDEALSILHLLVSHPVGKDAVSKENAIPFLIQYLRTGQERMKENAAGILLSLCKKDRENLACVGKLGALVPLTEISERGTERAKLKATSLLLHLQKMQNC